MRFSLEYNIFNTLLYKYLDIRNVAKGAEVTLKISKTGWQKTIYTCMPEIAVRYKFSATSSFCEQVIGIEPGL